ncbi:TorD/DmsD family molecular chaperone [Ottowia sp.]|uniref:TorD/DmsD family molecular chaperone n=1 Tax=Ottowia sp. TaxID=1898956 RepID=UPI003A85DA5A
MRGGTTASSAPAAHDWMPVAEDLRTLAWLHAQERTPEVLAELYANGFPETLAVLTADAPEVQAMAKTLQALASSHCESDAGLPGSTTDQLAADYAAIYLTHALRASPHESVWRDEDHLMLQAPTFAVRDFYRRHGVQVANWRQRADDHITHELEFVALLLERGEAREAARFLKTHLLAWLPQFATRVAQRADTPFYAALAALTLAACKACQQALPQVAVLPPVVTPADAQRQSGCGTMLP